MKPWACIRVPLKGSIRVTIRDPQGRKVSKGF